MKTVLSATLALCVLAATPLTQAADFQDFAKVLHVSPRSQQVNEPREVCHTEYQRVERREQSNAGAVIGGVTGALLGSRFGRGDGKTASTAAGAIVGAVVGDNVDNRDANVRVEDRPVRRCTVEDNWVTRSDGFQVDYEFRGHQYSTITPYDPGDRLQVRVSVVPAQ